MKDMFLYRSGFVITVLNPKSINHVWPITSHPNSAMTLSELAVKPCNRWKARENYVDNPIHDHLIGCIENHVFVHIGWTRLHWRAFWTNNMPRKRQLNQRLLSAVNRFNSTETQKSLFFIYSRSSLNGHSRKRTALLSATLNSSSYNSLFTHPISGQLQLRILFLLPESVRLREPRLYMGLYFLKEGICPCFYRAYGHVRHRFCFALDSKRLKHTLQHCTQHCAQQFQST